MNKTMYEVNWHYNNDNFSNVSVSPITVVRESILPGCTKVSITAIDSSGSTFNGSLDDYFDTKEQALVNAREIIEAIIKDKKVSIADINKEINDLENIYSYLENFDAKG